MLVEAEYSEPGYSEPGYSEPTWPTSYKMVCLLQSEELQDRIDNMDPELFLGEPDAPAEPDAIDGLLDGALPGTAGFQEDTGAQVDFMRDIMPEGNDDDAELEPEAAGNGDTPVAE